MIKRSARQPLALLALPQQFQRELARQFSSRVRTEVDLDSVIIDHFPHLSHLVQERGGMTAKQDALFLAADPDALLASLESGLPPSALRLRLMRLGDADLDGFCGDHFPMVRREFGDGMERSRKINLLLSRVSHHQLEADLGKFASQGS